MFASGKLLDPILINTIGHTAGVLLFGLIIVLLVRNGRAHGMNRIRLSLLAALLAFGWNAGSLIVIAFPPRESLLIGAVTTLSFSILSLLPAVLLQVALQGKQKWNVVSGYVISTCAVCLHFGEIFAGNIRLHQAALILIVAGFAVLTISALWFRTRQEPRAWDRGAEWVSLCCLLLFTTSFLHFGYEHASSPWGAEIAWHHLGIPVALIVLLQDYRFLLLDTFIRFLVNSCLAALYVAVILVSGQRLHLFSLSQSNTFLTGISIVALCLSLILFAHVRNVLQGWVSRVVFRRRNLNDCIQAISQLASRAQSEEQVLEPAAEEVARHLGTERFVVVKEIGTPRPFTKPSMLFLEEDRSELAPTHFHPEVQIPLRFSSGDMRFLLLGPRHGGRRYLSEDLDDMRRLGSAIVEQVERFRADELRRLVSQAELRALQAQINPHFLFNALNTLYGTIDRQSQEARRLVLNLADIFRYFLQGDRTMISLSEELRIVRAYLEIEKMRLGDRLETVLMIDDSLQDCLIPILSIQPLVENAVKHGIAPRRVPGRVWVKAERIEVGVCITVQDTGGGFKSSTKPVHDGAGMALENVRKRLLMCYGPAADLQIESGGGRTTIRFIIPDRAVESGTLPETALPAQACAN